MYLTVKFSGSKRLITKEIDVRDLEADGQQLKDIETLTDEGNLVLLTDTTETLAEFFPDAEIKFTD